jgi:hypothetical protein
MGMNKERPSTSSDLEIVRAAGEGMTKRHSEEGDKREARERTAEEKGEQHKK